jgi:hypothetical protein
VIAGMEIGVLRLPPIDHSKRVGQHLWGTHRKLE